ncbi:MAG: dihydrolipoamide acetyltransferase family protein [Dehalococcoidia bacterium]
MAEVVMPRLSDTMEEGSVQRWIKQPGDQVTAGEIIAEIETDKAVMELEAYETGVLQQILVPEGEVVPIGQPIAMIGDGAPASTATASSAASSTGAPATGTDQPAATDAGGATPQPVEATPAEAQPVAASAPPQQAAARQATPPPERNGRGEDGVIRASPVARRMAEEWGIDLSQVQGTGPGGRILRENVEDFHASGKSAAPPPAAPGAAAPAAASAQPAPAAASKVEPLSRMRRAIARTMTDSKPGVPHFYIDSEIDMGEALKLRVQINESGAADVKISVNDLIVKAVAKALRSFPAINSSYAASAEGQPGVIRHESINVSVATALDDGLLAPVVFDADKKSLSTVAAEIRDLAARAREGKIRQNELEGATFQVSNLGMFDVFAFISVITPPQAASLAIGSVRRVPVVQEDGQIGAADMMHVVLSADHRVTDGATGARFLQEVKRLLQTPLSLIV